VRQWVVQQRLPLTQAQPIEIELKDETLPVAVERLRTEINTVQQRLTATRSAPLPRSAQQEAVSAYLALGAGAPENCL
jgi:hypothetical protein